MAIERQSPEQLRQVKQLTSEILREACSVSSGVKYMLQLEYGKQYTNQDRSRENGSYVWRGDGDCTFVAKQPHGRNNFSKGDTQAQAGSGKSYSINGLDAIATISIPATIFIVKIGVSHATANEIDGLHLHGVLNLDVEDPDTEGMDRTHLLPPRSALLTGATASCTRSAIMRVLG